MIAMAKITIYPPGKRAGLVPRAPAPSNIPLTTQTALASPQKASSVPSAKDDRRTADERVRDAERQQTMSVALAQPHRRGSDDKIMESPLGRFCRQQWPPRASQAGEDLNLTHRTHMFEAGLHYGKIVHQHRVLKGLGSGSKTQEDGFSVAKTEKELRAELDLAGMKRDNADAVLRSVFAGAVSAMTRVAVDEIDPTPYQEGVLGNALWALAVHFGIVRLGINSEKSN